VRSLYSEEGHPMDHIFFEHISHLNLKRSSQSLEIVTAPQPAFERHFGESA
jgi:hypothetical protein